MPPPIKTARHLRQTMTANEKTLWQCLRNRDYKRWKFRRQHPFIYKIIDRHKYFYVADFYCAEAKLVIELDGKHHEFDEQKSYDEARDRIMKEMELKILRIKNEEFYPFNNTLRKIEEALASPQPSPHAEKE
jgi:leucyl-tRNA synthetase